MQQFPTSSLRTALIACNVYISAGACRKTDGPLLLRLLEQQQQSRSDDAVVVHAYADTVYDRSSFHLTGHAEAVSRMASDLAITAVRELRILRRRDYDDLSNSMNTSVSHPSVGLVDHVSMMPLTTNKTVPGAISDERNEIHEQAAGWAARLVGSDLEEHLGFNVLYYGMAHPDRTTLAVVRREQTAFFQSGGLTTKSAQHETETNISKTDPGEVDRKPGETATVGAPDQFVENYNVRLQCNRKLAQSLTRRVRERDGGLPGVEALTLPYSERRWEVACNLLTACTTGATATDIQAVVDQWEKEQQQGSLVETGYRVGTTVDQCLDAWESCMMSDNDRRKHDRAVLERFTKYLTI